MEGESARNILMRLRALGVHLSIDDFGTGYSSLSYLHQLPVDMLKVDRSFVSGHGEALANVKVVEAILALAPNIGLEVTAEGIETIEQAEQLRKLGCQYGQGYFFSPPLDKEGIQRLVGEFSSTTPGQQGLGARNPPRTL